MTNKTKIIVADFSSEFINCSIGLNEGNLSNDDHYAPLACATSPTSGYDVLIILDVLSGQEVSRKSLIGLDVDWMGMSQSGKWLVMKHGGTHKVYDINLNLVGDVGSGGHADLGIDTSGAEYIVSVDVSTDTIYKAQLPKGAKTAALVFPGNISGHISCRNILRPGYCYYSLRKASSSFHDINGSVSLVASDNTTSTEIFSYTRSTGNNYLGQPKGSVSPDGTKIVFDSESMAPDTGPVYSYVTELK